MSVVNGIPAPQGAGHALGLYWLGREYGVAVFVGPRDTAGCTVGISRRAPTADIKTVHGDSWGWRMDRPTTTARDLTHSMADRLLGQRCELWIMVVTLADLIALGKHYRADDPAYADEWARVTNLAAVARLGDLESTLVFDVVPHRGGPLAVAHENPPPDR